MAARRFFGCRPPAHARPGSPACDPVRLDPGAPDLAEALAGGAASGARSRSSRTAARSGRKGIGYGLLRDLNAEIGIAACRPPHPRDRLRRSRAFPDGGSATGPRLPRRWSLAGERPTCRRHRIEVNAPTTDGGNGATPAATWSGASGLLSQQEGRDPAKGWVEALEALVRHVEQPGAAGRTPRSAVAGASQAEIESLESKTAACGLPAAVCHCRRRRFHVFTMRRRRMSRRRSWCARCRARSTAPHWKRRRRRSWSAMRACGGFAHANLRRPVRSSCGARVPWRSLDLSLLIKCTRAAPSHPGVGSCELFDPASPPLLRFTLIRPGGEEHRPAQQPSHPDGWLSTPNLVRNCSRSMRTGATLRRCRG